MVGDMPHPTPTPHYLCKWQSWSCHLHASCNTGRAGPAPHLGSTVELVLVAWEWVSGFECMRAGELDLSLTLHSVGELAHKGMKVSCSTRDSRPHTLLAV